MSLRHFAYHQCTRNVKSVFFSMPYKLIALFLTLEVSQTQRDDKDELPAVIFKIHSGMDRGDKTRRQGQAS